MRELQNTGDAGYANNRMLDSVFNYAIEFCFSVASLFTSNHRLSRFNHLRQFSDSAVYPQTRKPGSRRVAQAPTATGSGIPGFPGNHDGNFYLPSQIANRVVPAEPEFTSFRPPFLQTSLENVI